MPANIVEILVKAVNETGPGFAEAKAQAVATAGEVDGLAAAEGAAAGKTATLGESFAAAQTKIKSFGTIGGIALASIGYESIKMGMSFQAAMERLVTQAGVAPSKLDALKAGVLALAGKVGFSPDSLAESLFHVESNFASLGITATKALSLVQIAAEGAKVGNANLEDVTNALTAAVASGIPGVQNFGQAMGALNAIVGAGDMKMQDLAEAMGTGVLAVVKGYGLSLKDVGAALDVFGDNNIRGAHAATALRMAVQSLAVPAATGKKLLADMGLSMTSLGKDMQTGGLLKALEDLQAHFKAAGITAQEQGDVITQIFGKKAGVGLAVLMDQMDRLKSKYPAITDGAKNFEKAWGETQQTLTQQWAQIRATFDSLMTALGEKLLPILSDVASFLLRHEGIIKTLAPIVLGLVGAFTALSLAMKAISLISELANPWVLAIIAIAAATYLLITHWKEVKRVAEEVWGAMYRTIVAPVVRAFDDVKNFITSNFDAWWKSHGEEVKEVWRVIWDAIMIYWKVVVDEFKVAMAILTAIFKVGWAEISMVFKVAWAIISAVVKIAVDVIKTYIKVTWDVIVGIFNVFLDLITGHWSKAWNDLLTMVKQVGNAILGFFKSLASDMFQAGVNVIEALLHGIGSMVGGAIHTVEGWGHDIANALTHPFGIHFSEPSEATQMIKAGRNIGAGLAAGMLSSRGAVAAAAAALSGGAGTGAGYGAGLAGGAGGGVSIEFNINGGGVLPPEFWRQFQNGVRAKGGDPRIVTSKVKFA